MSTRLCEDGIASTRLDRRTAAQRGKDGPRLRPTPCGDERRMRRETLLCEDGPRAEGPYRALSAKKAAPTATDPTLSAASSPVGGKKSRLRGEGKDGGASARQHGWIGRWTRAYGPPRTERKKRRCPSTRLCEVGCWGRKRRRRGSTPTWLDRRTAAGKTAHPAVERKEGCAAARQHGWIGGRLRREEKTAVRLRRETLMNRRAAARLRPTPRWKEKTAAARPRVNMAGSEGGRGGKVARRSSTLWR